MISSQMSWLKLPYGYTSQISKIITTLLAHVSKLIVKDQASFFTKVGTIYYDILGYSGKHHTVVKTIVTPFWDHF